MWKYLFFFTLFISSASAIELEHITLDFRIIPGSVRIEYGGIEGRAYREIEKFLRRSWDKQQKDYLDVGQITLTEYIKQENLMDLCISEAKYGGGWWTRKLIHSRTPEDGGAPKTPMSFAYGRTVDLINTPVFKLDTYGRFKLRELREDFGIKKIKGASILSWLLSAKPRISVGFSNIVPKPNLTVKNAGFEVSIIQSLGHIILTDLQLTFQYDVDDKDFIFKVKLRFLRW